MLDKIKSLESLLKMKELELKECNSSYTVSLLQNRKDDIDRLKEFYQNHDKHPSNCDSVRKEFDLKVNEIKLEFNKIECI